MAKLIFGCGYLGLRVATRWVADGHQVFAVTRSAARGEELASQGIRPIVSNLTDGLSLPAWNAVDTMLFAVGFDRSPGRDIHEVYVDGLASALRALPAETGRVIYISSTGVYGQSGGAWVDENSPVEPLRDGARACLAAEQLLARHPLGSRSIVLRLAGIYGPGRIPKLAALLAGQPVAAAGDAMLNLIHVDDAVEVVLAAELRGRPPARYVVSDGCPVRRADFYGYLATCLHADPPRFAAPAGDASASARGAGDKRVRTARLMAELAPALHYPSYREGLAAIVGDEFA